MKAAGRNIEVLRLRGVSDVRTQLAEDARRGLGTRPKRLPPKYFYDARGSELFERITTLPEYYPTRVETGLLETVADEVVASCAPQEIVEIGAGASRKNQLLLDAMHRHGGRRYVPIDVSEDALLVTGERLMASHPWLEFLGVVGDFERQLHEIPRGGRRLVAFLGSTIGNLDVDARVRFLASVRSMLGDDDRFLLGVDLVKSRQRLEAAYNDAAGVTAEFNKNALVVLNRELDGDLPYADFEHRAFYDRERERIEMHLVARRALRARLRRLPLELDFDAGESVQTEISCKFRRATVEEAFRLAGLGLERWMTDPAEDFALALGRRG